MLIEVTKEQLILSLAKWAGDDEVFDIVMSYLHQGTQSVEFDEKLAINTLRTIKFCYSGEAKLEYNAELIALCKDFIKQYEESE